MNTKNDSGKVWIVPVRAGRKKSFGALGFIEGHAAICIGYSEDGKSAVYVPRDQLKFLKGAYVKSRASLLVRVLNALIKRYGIEVRQAI